MAEKTVIMTKGAEKKHSVVYETDDPKAPALSIYFRRAFLGPKPPAEITLTAKFDE